MIFAKASFNLTKPTCSKFLFVQARSASSSSKGFTTAQKILFTAPIIAGAALYYNKRLFSTSMSTDADTPLINVKEFTPFKIKTIEQVNHDTKLYRFEIPNNQSLDLPVTSCLVTRKSPQEGESPVIRPYTPVSEEGTLGHFDLMIKHYPTGAMTSYMSSLKPGDSLDIKGPFTKYLYKPNTLKEVGLIAGGSGITPMLQLVRKILKNPGDNTKISLIFANRTENDILLRSEFDNYAKAFPDRFKVHYMLDKPPSNWTGGKGYITKEVLAKHLPSKDTNGTMVFVCGPDPMVKIISGVKISPQEQGEVSGLLNEMGYTKEQVYKF